MASSRSKPQAMDRAVALLQPSRRPADTTTPGGYLDLLGDDDPTGRLPGQRLMVSSALPLIYERLWRPLGGRLLMGALGPSMDDERRIAIEMLELSPGDSVLDVGCGPGNFTRAFAGEVGDGLAVGLDASRTMLAQGAAQPAEGNLAYIRGDAENLPFRAGSFDAVCCFAALYLIERPLKAVEELVRVLAPGGRVALLASVQRGPLPATVANLATRPLTGIRMFGRDELTGALAGHGMEAVARRVTGLAQFVSARKPAG
jgi:SAM-dependent methyltransferase